MHVLVYLEQACQQQTHVVYCRDHFFEHGLISHIAWWMLGTEQRKQIRGVCRTNTGSRCLAAYVFLSSVVTYLAVCMTKEDSTLESTLLMLLCFKGVFTA